ncbi:CpaF family protein [Propionibacterium freudenreichii]|uniref:CpaF family protein n=1 Tax=Propionibacterium freudenreichii TaxID=1744 RepID=UPI0021A969D1|nr:ATPase, T2SS/T4P/T4SS family [Propionibacterium freudenreichii]MCT2980950.1 secretion protein [Propionibacterium freudenreichii]
MTHRASDLPPLGPGRALPFLRPGQAAPPLHAGDGAPHPDRGDGPSPGGLADALSLLDQVVTTPANVSASASPLGTQPVDLPQRGVPQESESAPTSAGAAHRVRTPGTVPAGRPVGTPMQAADNQRPGAGGVPGPSGHQTTDWSIVAQLRSTISELITAQQARWEQEHHRRMADDDRRLMGRSLIRRAVHDYADELNRAGRALWPIALEQRYVKVVEDAIFGYGRMQPIFEVSEAENIEIHGYDCVFAQFGDGRRTRLDPVADSDDELVAAVRFLGENADPPRPFDDAHPTITVALGNKFRLHAVAFGLADRPSVIIRQHLLTEVSLKQLAHGSMMPTEVADLLRRCVLARKSVVISGDQGAGKTTLLRAMVGAIPATERFGTLETDYELLTHLQSRRQNMVALQAKIGLGEVVDGRRIGEYTVADLIPEALRQNLSRLVIGEVRGNEAGAMLQAMQSGAGALTTTHSHSAASTIDRLAARVAAGGVLRLDEAYRQIAYNVHLLVHVSLVDDTWRGGVRKRFISEIRALTGSMENGQPTTHLVYATSRTGEPQVFDPGQGLLDDLAPFAELTGAPATHRRSAGDPASRERGR